MITPLVLLLLLISDVVGSLNLHLIHTLLIFAMCLVSIPMTHHFILPFIFFYLHLFLFLHIFISFHHLFLHIIYLYHSFLSFIFIISLFSSFISVRFYFSHTGSARVLYSTILCFHPFCKSS